MVTVNQFGVKLRTISRNGLASLRGERLQLDVEEAHRLLLLHGGQGSLRQSIIPIDDCTRV